MSTRDGRTRAEHVRWCKQRAREILNSGDIAQALTSMVSDLSKHDATRELAINIRPLYLRALMAKNIKDARDFIEGFAE